jgi:hypothetical protein
MWNALKLPRVERNNMIIVVIVNITKAFRCRGSFRSILGSLAASCIMLLKSFFLSRNIPTGISNRPKIINPGRII